MELVDNAIAVGGLAPNEAASLIQEQAEQRDQWLREREELQNMLSQIQDQNVALGQQINLAQQAGQQQGDIELDRLRAELATAQRQMQQTAHHMSDLQDEHAQELVSQQNTIRQENDRLQAVKLRQQTTLADMDRAQQLAAQATASSARLRQQLTAQAAHLQSASASDLQIKIDQERHRQQQIAQQVIAASQLEFDKERQDLLRLNQDAINAAVAGEHQSAEAFIVQDRQQHGLHLARQRQQMQSVLDAANAAITDTKSQLNRIRVQHSTLSDTHNRKLEAITALEEQVSSLTSAASQDTGLKDQLTAMQAKLKKEKAAAAASKRRLTAVMQSHQTLEAVLTEQMDAQQEGGPAGYVRPGRERSLAPSVPGRAGSARSLSREPPSLSRAPSVPGRIGSRVSLSRSVGPGSVAHRSQMEQRTHSRLREDVRQPGSRSRAPSAGRVGERVSLSRERPPSLSRAPSSGRVGERISLSRSAVPNRPGAPLPPIPSEQKEAEADVFAPQSLYAQPDARKIGIWSLDMLKYAFGQHAIGDVAQQTARASWIQGITRAVQNLQAVQQKLKPPDAHTTRALATLESLAQAMQKRHGMRPGTPGYDTWNRMRTDLQEMRTFVSAQISQPLLRSRSSSAPREHIRDATGDESLALRQIVHNVFTGARPSAGVLRDHSADIRVRRAVRKRSSPAVASEEVRRSRSAMGPSMSVPRRKRHGKGSRSKPREKKFQNKTFKDAGVAIQWAVEELENWGQVDDTSGFYTVLAHLQNIPLGETQKLWQFLRSRPRTERLHEYQTLLSTLEQRISELGGATRIKKKKRTLGKLKKTSNLNNHSKEQVLKNVLKDTKKSATRALNVYKKFLKKNPKDADVQSIVETLERKLNPPVPTRGQVASKIKKMYKK